MQVKNTAADIEKSLRRLSDMDSYVRFSEADRKLSRLLASGVARSTKFALPDGGLLLEPSTEAFFTHEDLKTLRMPYEECLFVYHDKVREDPDIDLNYGDSALYVVDNADIDFIMCFPLMQVWVDGAERSKMWTPFMFGVQISKSKLLENPPSVSVSNLRATIIPLIEAFKDVTEDNPEGPDIQRVVTELTLPLLHVIAVLRCSNVRIEDIPGTGASEAVNAKRIRNGKSPLYTYKQLTVDSAYERAANDDGEVREGNHTPRRQHLRRGHIRRYKRSGKTIWINSMVVGRAELGVVSKEYNLKRKA